VTRSGRLLAACAVAIGALLAACGEDVAMRDDEPPAELTPEPEELTPDPDRPRPITPPGEVQPGLDRQVEQAKADLAERAGVDVEAITVVRAEAVVWPDGGLGCPEPGMAYPQVLTEGALIELEADGEVHRYHSGNDRPPFLCTDPQEPADGAGGAER
jgi:hypothetical protein